MDDRFIEYQKPRSTIDTPRSLSSERYPILVKNIDGTFALETVSGRDHTYAQKRRSLPSSNDHNYSCSRMSLWERQQNRKHFMLNDVNRRSSSEENLVRADLNKPKSDNVYSKKDKMSARKCHSVEEMVLEDMEVSNTSRTLAKVYDTSDLKSLPRPSPTCVQQQNDGMKVPAQTISPEYDHHYARDLEVISNNGIRNLNISQTLQSVVDTREDWEINEALMLAQALDHSYGKTLTFNASSPVSPGSIENVEQIVQNDHSYSGALHNSNCVFKATKFARASNTANWLQFKKDHTYSTKINSNA